ncbi:phosphate acyltransferase [Escherichia coli]
MKCACRKLGLQIKAGVDFEIVNNESDPRFKEYWQEYYKNLMKRRGITQEQAQREMRSNTTAIGSIMVLRGEADGMISGTIGDYHEHFSAVQPLFGYREGVHTAGAMNALLLPSGNTFYCRYLRQQRSDAGADC